MSERNRDGERGGEREKEREREEEIERKVVILLKYCPAYLCFLISIIPFFLLPSLSAGLSL